MKKPTFTYNFLKPYIFIGFGVFNFGFIYFLSTTFYHDSIEKRKEYKEIQCEVKDDVPDEHKDEYLEKILREYRKKN